MPAKGASLVDPNHHRGHSEPHDNNAKQRDPNGKEQLGQIARLIWHGLRWPYRYWRGGDHARRTANFTVLLALGTLALAGANFGMLFEMRSGTDQQHRDTLAALGKTDSTITAMDSQAAIMQGQLDEMRAEQRPWLFAPNIVLTEQVMRDVNGIRVSLGFTLTNSGHLPASNVHVNLSARGTHLYRLTEYAAAERKNCNQPSEFIGTSVFPNFTTQPPISWVTSISNDEIATAGKDFPPNFNRLWPMILACIVYRDPSGIDHHTPYILELVAIRDGARSPVIPSEAEELSKLHIILQQSITTGMSPD